MRHHPIIKLAPAISRYRIAVEECPHWDYGEYENGADYHCCHEMRAAAESLRKIKRQIAKSTPTNR